MKPHEPQAASQGPDFFAKHGYVMLAQAVSAADARRYAAYALMKRQHPGYYEEEAAGAARCRYGDVMGESLLRHLQPKAEAQTGLQLLPCHASLCIYPAGARMERRVDEPQREVSALLGLGDHASGSWPVWFDEDAGDKPVDLAPCDLLIYRGPRLPHWREPLVTDNRVEVALHFVTAGGEFINYRFDGRRGLGEPRNREQQDQCIALRKQFDLALRGGDDRPCFCRSGQPYSCCHGLMQQALSA